MRPTWQRRWRSPPPILTLSPICCPFTEHLSLVIKPHPQLPAEKIERPNTLSPHRFPADYPLLNRLDIYIGDMSSIGYDCLAFDKPMFFLNQNDREGLYLFGCGVEIKKNQYAEIDFRSKATGEIPMPWREKRPTIIPSGRSYLGKRLITDVKRFYKV